jgi:hypothetical protein
MNTNTKSLRETVNDVARRHLGIPSLYKCGYGGTINLTHKQIEKALREIYKMGEKVGYNEGYGNAKEACPCSLEEELQSF